MERGKINMSKIDVIYKYWLTSFDSRESAIEYFKTPSHLIGLIVYIVVAAVFVFVPEIIQSKDKENKIWSLDLLP